MEASRTPKISKTIAKVPSAPKPRKTARRIGLPESIAEELESASNSQAELLERSAAPKPAPRNTRSAPKRSDSTDAANRKMERAAKKLEIGSVTGIRSGALGPIAAILFGR